MCSSRIGLAAIASLGLIWLSAAGPSKEGVQIHRNLGKAHYEQGDYTLAAEELLKVLEDRGVEARDYFNAGMALLQSGDEDRALGAFATARQMDPELAAVDFGLGVLYKRQLRYPLALEAFQRVAARDATDPATWFNIGVVSFSMQKWEEAHRAFQRVLAMSYPVARNFYVSALFRQATLLARQGQQDQAGRLFEEFQRLRGELPNVSLTPTALENGRYGRIEIPPPVDKLPAGKGAAPVFSPLGQVRLGKSSCEGESSSAEPSVALGDYNGDGRLDLFLSDPCGQSRLLRNRGEGRFEDATAEAGLEDSREALGAIFADVDNSGFASLLVLSGKANRLYRNRQGKFQDVSEASGLGGAGAVAGSSAVFFDFDNDGLLDLFLSGSRPRGARAGARLQLYRNNGDGTFQDVSRRAGVGGYDGSKSRGAGFADFNEDGLSDLLVIQEGARALLLWNRGDGGFQGSTVPLASGGRLGARVEVVDLNRDGWLDALVLDEKGYRFLANRRGRLEAVSGLPALVPHPARWAVTLDADADGRLEILLRAADGGFHLLAHRGRDRFELEPVEIPDRATGSALAADLDGEGSMDLATVGADRVVRFFRRTSPARAPWIRVKLAGVRTNRQAMGAVVEVRAGSLYQKYLSRGLPLTLYSGDRERVDVVRVTWSNGVIQNALEVETRRLLEIVETRRQTSSCPFLYIWDGKAFRFLTDVAGRAPLGEPLPDGSLVRPYPEDYVRIPPGSMDSRDGRYVFQVTEELREVAYIDALELLVVDHPEGAEIYTDEKFSAPPFEPFRLYRVSKKHPPLRALNAHGENVLPELLRADGRYVAGFSRHRIPGLAEEHALLLDPGEVCRQETLRLFLSGWVYWPSSSSMKALATNGALSPRSPELQVRDDKGRWVTVEDLGLPSGINRTLTADLSGKFLSRDCTVRVVTNLAVYWDEAFFAGAEAPSSALVRPLRPASADLHYRGFSMPVLDRGGSRPEYYDYRRRLPEAPWNAAEGRYTRYGDVSPLVETPDDRLVVMAPGDELTISFEAGRIPPLAEGWRRDFILHVSGWAKDNDPNTLFSRTVEPLPVRGMGSYAFLGREPFPHSEGRQGYLEGYQT
ncbi:MAG: FG-GAP-like repeat-containing protein, partial [Acidobacteriota bacterium]